MTDRRFFSDTQRAALFLAADGRCTNCGSDLQPGWHADHEKPHSVGGPTDVINGQALCPTCNLQKGSTVSGPRKWQADALREFMLWQPEGDNGFLVEATPGAGKTRLAIQIAARLLDAGTVAQIIVAVPSSRLETQWHEEFAKQGININPKWHAADGRLANDEQGCAATYAEIAKQPQIYRRLAGRTPTLVILDEVHHCGEERTWGDGIRTAFAPAVRKLLLSGTPFRSDNNSIPFVRYVDGAGAPEYRYGYDRALADRVVRAVFFPRRGGSMEWDWKGQGYTATFDEALRDDQANRRLRTALSVRGQWIPSVLADADRQLAELRESDPTAGGIVFCETSDDARQVADLLRGLGRHPVLAITDEADSVARIGTFRDSREPWIVSIRMVSEGVDIPRLRVGVYATPWLTEMFFRQVVGRLVRTKADEDDPTSYLYIPDDERLRSMAETIKEQRDHILDVQADEQLDLFDQVMDGASGEQLGKSVGFVPISATATDQGVIVDAVTITSDELAQAERIKLLAAETANLPTAIVAKLLRNAGATAAAQTARPEPAANGPTQLDRKQSLKQANNTAVARICKNGGLKHGVVNGILSNMVGLPSSRGLALASETQLRTRLGLAQQWLATGRQPGTGDGH